MTLELALVILLYVWSIILIRYFLLLFDDLKARIDRRVDAERWLNDVIERLMERVNKLEKTGDLNECYQNFLEDFKELLLQEQERRKADQRLITRKKEE